MISRRIFFGLFAIPRMIVLDAVAAPVMPQTKFIRDPQLPGRFIEFRTYRSPIPAALLRQSGIRTIRQSPTRYLFAFDSLEARQQAWTALASHPQWTGLHATEISLYRRLS